MSSKTTTRKSIDRKERTIATCTPGLADALKRALNDDDCARAVPILSEPSSEYDETFVKHMGYRPVDLVAHVSVTAHELRAIKFFVRAYLAGIPEGVRQERERNEQKPDHAPLLAVCREVVAQVAVQNGIDPRTFAELKREVKHLS